MLLCQPLLPPRPPPSAALGGSGSAAAFPPAPKNAHQSAKELRKKMVILGMIHGPPQHQAADSGPLAAAATATASAAAGGRRAGAAEDRAAAQTRWLDGATGKLFGGSWGGSVRTGASCDTASLELRARVEVAKKGEAGGRGADGEDVAGRGVATVALAKWKPNPDTPDPEKWGGKWGKPCGHNEVRGDGVGVGGVVWFRNRTKLRMRVEGCEGFALACHRGCFIRPRLRTSVRG